MTISIAPLAILFDADGVLQQPPPDWQRTLARMAGAEARQDAFLADVFAAEAPCLRGQADFRSELSAVLQRWHSPCSVDEALTIWTDVQVDHAALALVDALRARKLRCYLTTNQNPVRAAHMSANLQYATRFDGEFYSCRLGHAKPSRAYFEAVLEAIVLPPSRVVFIDDHPDNVAAAREVGLQAAVFDGTGGADMLRANLQAFGIR